MADARPFTSFNFSVEIEVKGVAPMLCNAAFSECDGLDMSMEVKTIREGGNNKRQIRLVGPSTFGQVTLKRGVTSNFDLWDWFSGVMNSPAASLRTDFRGQAKIVLLAADGQTEQARFVLDRCLPVKLKAPAMNGKEGGIAIEEFQMTYENLSLKRPEGVPSA
jgi:phage tail-like protein